MSSVIILFGTLLVFALGYKLYGATLARAFGIDPAKPTPAHTKEDGRDFVPAKNWWVLFGHHFSSICGAGPIVGPVLGVAYWGWGPSILWLLVGAVFMGAVSDFSSLFVSVRSEGESMPEIARPEISPRARILFSIFIWLSLVLVIAVFAIFAAKTYIEVAQAVLPSWGLIPVALLTGFLLYRTKWPLWASTLLGLGLLGLVLFLGNQMPLVMPAVGGLSGQNVWILLLLVYAFVASVAPVNVLLQPRDYLASFLLMAAIGVGVVSVLISQPTMDETALYSLWPQEMKGAGPIWPMLFVTIACGAISGFHSLVSSGTTCKQLGNEAHACRVGYGGMLVEGLVGALVVICVAAGLSRPELMAALKAGGPITAFSKGYGSVTVPLLGSVGGVFAVVALNAFILTTLDTATRIGRYLTSELFGIKSIYGSTFLVVLAAGILALTGQWTRIWPAFGTSNQLVAALSLLVASCWLLHRGRPVWYTLVPALIMLVTTLAAFAIQFKTALGKPDYFLSGSILILMVLALVVFAEGWQVFRRVRAGAKPASQT